MSTSYYNIALSSIDSNGNPCIVYPKTKASNVIMENGNSAETELTNKVSETLSAIGLDFLGFFSRTQMFYLSCNTPNSYPPSAVPEINGLVLSKQNFPNCIGKVITLTKSIGTSIGRSISPGLFRIKSYEKTTGGDYYVPVVNYMGESSAVEKLPLYSDLYDLYNNTFSLASLVPFSDHMQLTGSTTMPDDEQWYQETDLINQMVMIFNVNNTTALNTWLNNSHAIIIISITSDKDNYGQSLNNSIIFHITFNEGFQSENPKLISAVGMFSNTPTINFVDYTTLGFIDFTPFNNYNASSRETVQWLRNTYSNINITMDIYIYIN